jgi:hypothetical protein
MTEITTFYNRLNTIKKSIDEVRQSFDVEMAFDFNALKFFNVHENKTSQILAYFMNPSKQHGQGNLFLKLFYQTLYDKVQSNILNASIADNAKVKDNPIPHWDLIKDKVIRVILEEQTHEMRRVDILIEIGNKDFIVGVENKIYTTTEDQESQLKHYSEYLENVSKGRYILVYLSPKGKVPAEHSINKVDKGLLTMQGKYVEINYEDNIIPLVNSWHIHCRAQRVKSFLQDLEQHFKNQYTEEKFMEVNDKLIKEAILPNNIQTTLILLKEKEGIYKRIIKTLHDEIKEKFEKQKLTLKWDFGEKQYNGFEISSDILEKHQLKIAFQFQEADFKKLIWGLKGKRNDKVATLFDEAFKEHYRDFDTSNLWARYASFYPANWNNEQFEDICKDKTIYKKIAELADRILELDFSSVDK